MVDSGGQEIWECAKEGDTVVLWECMKSIDCEKLRGQISFSIIVFFGDSRLAYLIFSPLS